MVFEKDKEKRTYEAELVGLQEKPGRTNQISILDELIAKLENELDLLINDLADAIKPVTVVVADWQNPIAMKSALEAYADFPEDRFEEIHHKLMINKHNTEVKNALTIIESSFKELFEKEEKAHDERNQELKDILEEDITQDAKQIAAFLEALSNKNKYNALWR